jgi:hypothetical protein
MRPIGALRAAICAATIICPGLAAAQQIDGAVDVVDVSDLNDVSDATVAQAPQASASLTPIADSIGAAVSEIATEAQDTARPVAIQYSDGHYTRAKIHKYASFATLPLLATEFVLGQQLYNDPQSLTSSKRGVHAAVGAGLIGLFAVNSVTGVWNLVDSRQAPGHTKRMVHGIMMLVAEGGLIASAASAPGHGRNDLVNFDANKATHRNIAVFSIGVGTAGYLFMLFAGH